MIEDIQRRRQERIRKIMNVEEEKRQMYTQPPRPPVEMHIAEAGSWLKAELPLVSVNQEHRQRDDGLKSGSEQLVDPEQQWKINRAKWDKRYGWEDKHTGGTVWRRSLRMRMLISILLFASAYGVMTFPVEWNAPMRTWIVHSLTEEMDMRPLAAWYERTFSGTPVFIPLFPKEEEVTLPVQVQKSLHPPMKGKIVRPFAMNMKSVVIAPDDSGSSTIEVCNVATGRIERVTTDTKEGITVTVRHADGLVTLYGGLASSPVQKGDQLEVGEMIGVLQGGREGADSSFSGVLTFSMQQHGVYIDPSDVIRFD